MFVERKKNLSTGKLFTCFFYFIYYFIFKMEKLIDFEIYVKFKFH